MAEPVVAIIGRPNVGKSTLFNRLVEHKKAIVVDVPGATRDRNYGDASWGGRNFLLIDTGGFEPVSEEKILVQMREQSTLAVEEADCVIFLLDVKDGLVPADRDISNFLRRSGKPVFYAVNKVDSPAREKLVAEFYALGAEKLHAISAEHGLGISELMDAVAQCLVETKKEECEEERIRIAVVGRPNVGKSSLINRILGYERVIVNPLPGTTRDAIDTPFEYAGRKYLLIDTAGIRRKSRISINLEKYSTMEAIKTLRRSDVALILIDAVEGITEQDARIAGLAFERGCLAVVVINKWDLLDKDNSTLGAHVRMVKERLKFLDYAPIVFISALTGQRVFRIFDEIDSAFAQYSKRVKTSELNDFVRSVTEKNPPPRVRGKPHNFSYATQASVRPPTFVFFVRDPRAVHFSYERFLVNQIRNEFGFEHSPVRILFRRKGK